MQHPATTHCNALQGAVVRDLVYLKCHTATHCNNTLQHITGRCFGGSRVPQMSHCNTLQQHTATHYRALFRGLSCTSNVTLRHTATTHCNTLQGAVSGALVYLKCQGNDLNDAPLRQRSVFEGVRQETKEFGRQNFVMYLSVDFVHDRLCTDPFETRFRCVVSVCVCVCVCVCVFVRL